jgi:uncharacterized cupredoxin-like copper-binding protein
MRLVRRAHLTLPLAVVLAACTGAPATSTAPPSTSAAPSVPASGDASPVATRVEVTLVDALKIEPSTMSVPAGVPVTFVVTNAGVADHEFFVGDEDAQAAHEAEMAEMGGMAHDEEMGIGVKPGETKELTITFPAAGSTLAGCHVAGHYAAGMKATIEVTE